MRRRSVAAARKDHASQQLCGQELSGSSKRLPTAHRYRRPRTQEDPAVQVKFAENFRRPDSPCEAGGGWVERGCAAVRRRQALA